MEELHVSLEKFIKTLNIKMKTEGNSKNTITSYNHTYKTFVEFSKQHYKKLTFSNLREDNIYEYIQYRTDTMDKQGELSSSSINSLVAHLKRLFTHIERNSDALLDFDKVFADIKVKKIKRIPKGLSSEEIDKLMILAKEYQNSNDFIKIRNIILLKLMLLGGLRASEALTIKISDFKRNENLYKISFFGKGTKIRTTFVKYNDFSVLINEYKKVSQYDLVATTSNGNIMDRFQLTSAIKNLYKISKIKVSGLHILRHTAAKTLLDNNVSIVAVQSLLGHSSIETTSIYANPTEDIIIQQMRN